MKKKIKFPKFLYAILFLPILLFSSLSCGKKITPFEISNDYLATLLLTEQYCIPVPKDAQDKEVNSKIVVDKDKLQKEIWINDTANYWKEKINYIYDAYTYLFTTDINSKYWGAILHDDIDYLYRYFSKWFDEAPEGVIDRLNLPLFEDSYKYVKYLKNSAIPSLTKTLYRQMQKGKLTISYRQMRDGIINNESPIATIFTFFNVSLPKLQQQNGFPKTFDQ